VLAQLLSVADGLGVARVFCLMFEVDIFAGNGFEVLEGTPVEPEVYAQSPCSYDEGVAARPGQAEDAGRHPYVADALIQVHSTGHVAFTASMA